MRATPDGYTLQLMAPAKAIYATLYDNLTFDFIRDIAPIAGIIRVPNVVEVTPHRRSRRSLNSSLMPRPIRGRSTWRLQALGHNPTSSGELFKMLTGINIQHVPYRGDRARTDGFARPARCR